MAIDKELEKNTYGIYEKYTRKQINRRIFNYTLVRAKEDLPIIGWTSAAACAVGAIIGGVSYAITKDPASSVGLGVGFAFGGTSFATEAVLFSYDASEVGSKIRELKEMRARFKKTGLVSLEDKRKLDEDYKLIPLSNGRHKKRR